jgi:predicted DNA-binding transcriptional regulator YafY
VDSPFSQAPAVQADVLATVAQTTRDGERLRFTYRAAGGRAAGSDLGRHVEPHQLVTVGRRWYLVAYDLDRQDWRSFRLDRLRDPMGTRARFRARAVPGGDPAAFVREGMSRGEQELRVVAEVHARADVVARRIGRWGKVTAVSDDVCRLEMTAREAPWLLFGLAVVEAPFTLEEAPDVVRSEMAEWAGRFSDAASLAGSAPA